MRKWVKLYTKILLDPDMHRLSDGAYRACVNLIVLAGILDKGGELGTVADVTFHLRLEMDIAQEYLDELAKFDFARAKKGVWSLRNWDKLQNKPASDAPDAVKSRVKKHRENKVKQEPEPQASNESVTPLQENGNESVTASNEPRLEENRLEEKREEERGASAAPQPKTPKAPIKKPEQPAAVMAFREAAGAFPPKALWASMDEAIGAKSADLEFWESVVRAWIARGYNPRNVSGMFDFYKRRELPAANGNGGKKGPDPTPLYKATPAEIEQLKTSMAAHRTNQNAVPR